ncbi:hypothetical protein AC623_04340 [Bacillus sp. FJAT-27231]|uniref:hypothetical protein n=1 Tax=Bacillus sp. FJAT-27231 TaxID=1679168 RepID=UPI0006709953|nr:hypothetical protein [Bacillus sp. FJAT-27231]KMY53314.1 hypothetical protein AC623_04340 [Bacillus sp. FJAT-27231]
MKTRVGVVGPRDSIQLMKEVAKEYENQLDLVPFVYSRAEETTSIVEENQHLVDIWLFSGLTPYTLAKKSTSNQPFFYLKLNGSSFMKALLEAGYKDQKCLNNISIDMLDEKDIYETYGDLQITHENIYWYEYKGYTPIQEISDFHINLFNEGKVSVCVTCLSDVFENLRVKGIPVYRSTPTRANIRSTISLALQYWQTVHFKQSQITVMLIKMENMEKIESPHVLSYELHRLNLELQSAILDFSETIAGSFVAIGIGTYIIFSTRGSLQEAGEQSVQLLEKISLITDLPSNIGIGYGDTALAAEENARLALHHAQNYGKFSVFVVENNGVVKGPLEDKQSISFGFRNENKEIGDKLKQSGVSITTFNKIMAVQKSLGRKAITASEIAEWLKMTQRNARRILTDLTKVGIAEEIGEEAPTSRGRPRKIYRVGLDVAENHS